MALFVHVATFEALLSIEKCLLRDDAPELWL